MLKSSAETDTAASSVIIMARSENCMAKMGLVDMVFGSLFVDRGWNWRNRL